MRKKTQFVSRSGLKLDAALDAFGIEVAGRICVDFGCNVGGFTDCLLRRNAAKVYAVDTGYGALAWKLRKDPRVVACERTNALHMEAAEPADLVAIDVAWTPQELIVPAAMRWLKPVGSPGRQPCVISLLKPQYELAKMHPRRRVKAITDSQADTVCLEVCRRLADMGMTVRAVMRSVLRGRSSVPEFLIMLR